MLFSWLGIKSVDQTFTYEEIENLEELDIVREIGEVQDLLNDEKACPYGTVAPMVKAIVFDCFGVLATETLAPFREKYFGSDPQLPAQLPELVAQDQTGGNYTSFRKRYGDPPVRSLFYSYGLCGFRWLPFAIRSWTKGANVAI